MSLFVFQQPLVFAALLALIGLAWLLRRARRKRAELAQAMGAQMSTQRTFRERLRMVGLVCCLIALARPGYAPEVESNSQTGRDVIFALDVSRSMLANDLSPSRQEIAKQSIRDALKTFGNERVGLVIYGGSASILCPLTYDYNFVSYMLEGANPLSVDFGGTTLQAAVEKVVDQMLIPEREGVQDLIVLTDGGDNGSNLPKISERLTEHSVDLLLIGIGDSNIESTIPITDEEGTVAPLRIDGKIVTTRLEDSSLRELAQQSENAEYFAAGTQLFNLGQVYADYSQNRLKSSHIDRDQSIVRYKEAAPFFIALGIICFVLAERWGHHGLRRIPLLLAVLILSFSSKQSAQAQDEVKSTDPFERMQAQAYAEAETLLLEQYKLADVQATKRSTLAALQYNRGLCLQAISQEQAQDDPRIKLNYIQRAQAAFLSAKRYAPQLSLASAQLENCHQQIIALEAHILEKEAQEAELEAELQELIEALVALRDAQNELREKVENADPSPPRNNRQRNETPASATAPSEDLQTLAESFTRSQQQLNAQGINRLNQMQIINRKLSPPQLPGIAPIETLLTRPLELMADCINTQNRALKLIQNWADWSQARKEQLATVRLIEEILSLLTNPNQDPAESEESGEMEDYDSFEETDDVSESSQQSDMAEADFASDSETKELPVPNYSAEDILREEVGNQQFRESQRAKSNAQNVQNDY